MKLPVRLRSGARTYIMSVALRAQFSSLSCEDDCALGY